jgi:hypothetical protein
MPGIASNYASVEFSGDQLEDALQTGVEAVQGERH